MFNRHTLAGMPVLAKKVYSLSTSVTIHSKKRKQKRTNLIITLRKNAHRHECLFHLRTTMTL